MTLRGAIYRWFMRWMHKYNWHYAPLVGPFEDGSTQRWCKWCGLRETYRPRSGFKNLRTSSDSVYEFYDAFSKGTTGVWCPDVIYPGKLSTPKVNPCPECHEETPSVGDTND